MFHSVAADDSWAQVATTSAQIAASRADADAMIQELKDLEEKLELEEWEKQLATRLAADEVELAAARQPADEARWAADEIEIAAIWADVDVQLVADREEIERIFAATFNTLSDDKELKVHAEISITTDLEDSNTGGGTMNTTSSNEIEDMVHEIFDAPQAQSREIEAKKNPEDYNTGGHQQTFGRF